MRLVDVNRVMNTSETPAAIELFIPLLPFICPHSAPHGPTRNNMPVSGHWRSTAPEETNMVAHPQETPSTHTTQPSLFPLPNARP